jgi:hypothetical protein
MTKDIREYTEPKPKKKKTVEELNSWLQDLIIKSDEELKKSKTILEKLRSEYPEI